MTGKMKLYIGLLVLGLVLLGGGLWFLFNPVPVIDIPEGTPVIVMDITYTMRGEASYLGIFEDGAVIYIEDENLRMPTQENPPTRTWKTSRLQEEELSELIEFFTSSQFAEMDADYSFPGVTNADGGVTSDMICAISINHGDLHKTVTAFGYLTPDRDMTYPDMPYPLNEIYKRLKDIAENRTEEVYLESI